MEKKLNSTPQKPDSDMEDNYDNDFPLEQESDISHFNFNQDDYSDSDEDSKSKSKISYEAKIVQLLANLHSIEFKIHSEAAKEFIKLLRTDSGGELLNQFIQKTDNQPVQCKDLLDLWKQRQGKSGVVYVLNLISEILSHPDGKYKRNDRKQIVLSRKIDRVCDAVMERLDDVYLELNSKEGKQQNAALRVVTAVIRRGIGYASQVVEKFDFKNPVFPKLAEYNHQKKKVGDKKRKCLTRDSFIEFAMSLLEMGNPRLLRWVLQVKGMYYSVLRGLESDDDEIIVYVLSTLRDRVLVPQSLVPPSLRSVLFGSVTLEQLIHISGNPDGGPSAKIAHEVLVMVCTDPSNGLMPDLKSSSTGHLKGNRERLMELMKKLRPTEIGYHRELLLEIVRGRPSFGAAYMDEFPFVLEPRASSTWFSAISLATDMVSATRETMTLNSVVPSYDDPPSLDSFEMQCLLKCTLPRAFSRIVINRGLLHSDIGVRHGSLRLLLEALKSLNSLLSAVECKSGVAKDLAQKWTSLRQKIQDEARALLPDSQVLYKLLSNPSQSDTKIPEMGLKRRRSSEELPAVRSNRATKKLKSDFVSEDVDIIVGGVATESDNVISEEGGQNSTTTIELEKEEDSVKAIAEIWGLHNSNLLGDDLKDAETLFVSKLLDALALYLRTMPMVLDGSFDFFKVLPSDPFTLSVSQQRSLLSLLIEYIGWSPHSRTRSFRPPDSMYKHLQPLLDLLIHSPVKDIQNQAYILAKAAILSTGVFDRNLLEIDEWLLFLPGYRRNKSSIGSQAVDVIRDSSKVVISFLCDAVSTMGNNRYKYMDTLRSLLSSLKESASVKEFAEVSPSFSPLFICTLQKCIRLLESDSGTFKLYEKSMVSMYVCNTLSFILQTQVDGRIMSSGIDSILTKGFNNSSLYNDSMTSCCEWRPLKNLQLVSRRISDHKIDSEGSVFGFNFLKDSLPDATCQSFSKTLDETKKVICSVGGGSLVGATKAFCSSIVCASPIEILENFPSVLTVSAHLLGANLSFLSSIFFHEGNFLVEVANRWPDIFFSSLELLVDPGIATDGKDGALHENTNSLSSSLQGSISSMDFDSIDSTSAAFRTFLKQASFFELFSAIMGVGNSDLLDSSNLLLFLQGKLSEVLLDDSVTSIRLILFWANHIQSSYKVEPLCELEKLSKICSFLMKDMLDRLFVKQSDFSSSKVGQGSTATSCIQEIAETVFHHPAVLMSLYDPLLRNVESSNGILAGSSVDFLDLSNRSINPISDDILHLLTTVADHLLGLGKAHDFISEAEVMINRRLLYIFKNLVQRVILMLKEKFEMPMDPKKLTKILPSYYVLHALIHVIPPFMLLELVEYIFESSNSIGLESVKIAISSIGSDIADSAFDLLSCYSHQPDTTSVRIAFFLEIEGKGFNATLIENVYQRVLSFATHFKVECADSCILKAVNVVYKQKFKAPRAVQLPYSMVISRVIMSSPVSLIGYCIQGITATKAKILFQITELSPLHLTLFGQMFLSLRCEGRPLQESVFGDDFNCACTDEQFIMLLPVAVSYLKMSCLKFGVHYLKHFHHIPAIYSKILLKGFRKWKSYTCGKIFQEEYGELSLSSTEELLSLFGRSSLGKAIHMLRYDFSLNAYSMKVKKRMKLFDSICPCPDMDDNFMDLDGDEIDTSSLSQSLNFINRVIAKISLCRMLLLPKNSSSRSLQTEENGNPEDISSVVSFKEVSAVVRFINILVRALDKIVKRFPLVISDSVRMPSADCSQQFRYLELFILRNIFELSVETQGHTNQMSTVTFVEDFARSSLVYRFEDPYTLRVLRAVLISLCEGKFSCAASFELLLAHSKFIPSITWSDSNSDSSDHLNSGMLLKPMHSVLKSQFPLATDQGDTDNRIVSIKSSSYRQKLEIIKLLRVLYRLRASLSSIPPEEDSETKAKELLSLLLSCYGATVCEVDLEIFDLMQEIVSMGASDCVNIAEMDYLWGTSALKLRERKLEDCILSDNISDSEAVEKRRRRQFRENIALDFRICAATILNYPFDRVMSHTPICLKNISCDDLMGMQEDSSTSMEKKQRYDPAFILRFSIHGLSMGYLNPLEFAGLGLLAIAFMSVSSPDEGIRKLGYEVLGRFKNAVLSHQKKTNDLRLLLANLQMEITEPWQRIPSMTAIFVAEASLILLDPSHDKFETMKKQISSKVNFQCIPLFKAMFESVSRNFKTDRLWILRLSHAGLNFEDDAQIFIRKGIMETLLSFYSSSLSDCQSKTLIFQIIKKSMKFPVLARHLVQKCNLISWMSSVLASFGEQQLHDSDNNIFLTQTTLVLEVLHGVLSTEPIIKWLKKGALEQLSELSLHTLKLLMGNENKTLSISVLQILISTLGISQERELDHPRFTLSYGDLSLLNKTIDQKSNISTNQLIQKVILMSTPPAILPHKGEKLLNTITSMISTASKSYCHEIFDISHEMEESIMTKLLRWVTASIILGTVSVRPRKTETLSSLQTLKLFLENTKSVDDGETLEVDGCGHQALAGVVLYLQQLLGMNCKMLPSVVCALCLLLLPHGSSNTGVLALDDNQIDFVTSMCSKIRSPAEADSAWRWWYDTPWGYTDSEMTEVELEEHQACQSVLLVFSNALRDESSQCLSYKDLEESSVFMWEKNVFLNLVSS